MDVTNVLIRLLALASGTVFVISIFIAYTKRKEDSFLGGLNILDSLLWIIFPYSEYGIEKDKVGKEIVLWARISFAALVVSGYYALKS